MAGGIKAVIATQFDPTGLNKAVKEFGKLGSSIKGILGVAGVGFGVAALTKQLSEAGKAAAEDFKAQQLLANQLRNTVGANDSQIASVEKSISAMELQSAVADDVLRPAFAQLVRATGDVSSSTRLMQLALDVAAGTGKDVGAVTIALGKAYQGNSSALTKLGINVKGMKDPLAYLESQFTGMAKAAGDTNPYARLSIVMQNLQEEIGTYLLPYMEEFANYLGSPAGQADLANFADAVGNMVSAIGNLSKALNNVGFTKGMSNFMQFVAEISGGDFGSAFGNLRNNLNSDAINGWVKMSRDDPKKYKTSLAVIKENAKELYKEVVAAVAANNKALSDSAMKAREAGQANAFVTPFQVTPFTGAVDPTAAAALKAAQAAAKAAAKKAAAEAAAIAKSVAAANAEMAKSAEEAMAKYTELMIAYSEQVTAVNEYKNSLLDLTDAIKPLAFEEKTLGRFAQASADSFDAIASNIRENSKMFMDGGASLLAYVAKERRAIEQLASQRDALAEKYSLAKAVKNDIEGAVRSFGNITNALETQSSQVTETMTTVVDGIKLTRSKLVEQTTTKSIVANFQAILDKTKAFAVSLNKLRALGLDENLYKQIVDAGVDAGGQTAEAILAGGSDTVGSLNAIFKDLNKVGADIGEQTAQVMYGAGVDLTNGLLEGIKSKDQELIDQARAMAKAFSDSFNSELALNLASPTAPVMPGTGIDATDFIPGYGRVTSTGTNPNGQPVTININAGVVANKQELPQIIVDALGTYTKQSGAGGLTRVLGL